MDAEAGALDARARRHRGERLERRDERGAAVRVAGVVERVDADDDVARVEDLGPAERQREENRVPRRHVGGGNAGRVQVAVARHARVGGERRPADGAKVDRQLQMLLDAEPAGDGTGRLQLPRVALPVVNGQRTEREALGFGDRRGGVGVETAAQQDHRSHLVNW